MLENIQKFLGCFFDLEKDYINYTLLHSNKPVLKYRQIGFDKALCDLFTEKNSQGYCIHFNFNSSSNTSVETMYMERVNAFFLDYDGGQVPMPQIEDLLKPNIKMTRSIGRGEFNTHYYFLLDSKKSSITECKAITEVSKKLTLYAKSDKQTFNISRLGRLPFFKHRKNNEDNEGYNVEYLNEEKHKVTFFSTFLSMKNNISKVRLDPSTTQRNVTLFNQALQFMNNNQIKGNLIDEKSLLKRLHRLNLKFEQPLETDEVQKIAKSVMQNGSTYIDGSAVDRARREVTFLDEIRQELSGFVYIEETGEFYHVDTDVRMDKNKFHNRVNSILGDQEYFKQFNTSLIFSKNLIKSVRKFDYIPNSQEKLVYPEDDDLYTMDNIHKRSVNIGTYPVIEESLKTPDIFIEHLHKLIPDEKFREYFINWLAHLVQKPHVKQRSALLILSTQHQVGKSIIASIFLKKCFGKQVQILDSADKLTKNFNRFLIEGVLCLVINEVQMYDKQKFYESVKSLITEDTMLVEEKNIPVYQTKNLTNILMFSNHKNALQIPRQDARFRIYESPMRRQNQDYYTRLINYMDENHHVIWSWLKRRNIIDFNPFLDVQTQAREEMSQYSNHEIWHFIKEKQKAREGCFRYDCLDLDTIRDSLPIGVAKNLSLYKRLPSILNECFRKSSFRPRVTKDGKESRISVYVLSEDPKYDNDDEVKLEYKRYVDNDTTIMSVPVKKETDKKEEVKKPIQAKVQPKGDDLLGKDCFKTT